MAFRKIRQRVSKYRRARKIRRVRRKKQRARRKMGRRLSRRTPGFVARGRAKWRGKSRRQKAYTLFGLSMPMLAALLVGVWFFFIKGKQKKA